MQLSNFRNMISLEGWKIHKVSVKVKLDEALGRYVFF
jgi:hypothetical protein